MRRARALAAAALVAASGCGGGGAPGNGADVVFAEAMVEHHRSAIRMAAMAEAGATTPFVRRLSGEIVASQRRELATLERVLEELRAAGTRAEKLKLEPEHLPAEALDALEQADEFDRALIDEMVPHHVEAIEMAKVELARGSHPALLATARGVIESQGREVREMNRFRTRRYGAPAPTAVEGGGPRH